MLYLLKQPSWESDKIYFKVGYAENMGKRFLQYASHSPATIKISEREGGLVEERLLHRYFHTMTDQYTPEKDEWYLVPKDKESEFISEFMSDYDDIRNVVWENRESLLKASSDLDLNIWGSIWTQLKFKYMLVSKGGRNSKVIEGSGILSEFDSDFFFKLYKDYSIVDTLDESMESYEELRQFFGAYDKFTKVSDRLKYLCEYPNRGIIDLVLRQLSDSDKVKELYTVVGPEKCKADGYNITDLKKSLGIVSFSGDTLRKAIYYQFKEGDRYSLKDIKSVLGQIYNTISCKKTPKASDLEEFFEIKTINLNLPDGKRSKGYELIKKLK